MSDERSLRVRRRAWWVAYALLTWLLLFCLGNGGAPVLPVVRGLVAGWLGASIGWSVFAVVAAVVDREDVAHWRAGVAYRRSVGAWGYVVMHVVLVGLLLGLGWWGCFWLCGVKLVAGLARSAVLELMTAGAGGAEVRREEGV